MTIQFQCAACSQPIEVDPEWGGRAVVCPYCRKAVTAPQESTYFPGPQAPVARPACGPTGFEAISTAPAVPAYYFETPSRNAVAVWALVLSLASVACLVAVQITLRLHTDVLRPLEKMVQEGKSYREINQAFMEQFQNVPPYWMVLLGLLMLSAFGLWLAGLVCAIIGVRRRPRRELAVIALVVSSLLGLLFLLGPLIG